MAANQPRSLGPFPWIGGKGPGNEVGRYWQHVLFKELTEPTFIYVDEVAKQRGTPSLRHFGLTVFVVLKYWITGTENSSDQEIPLTVFIFNENIYISKSESHSVTHGC